MSTVGTMFANNIDFYLSFGIGISLAVAAIGIYQTVSSYKYQKEEELGCFRKKQAKAASVSSYGVARGDIRTFTVVMFYVMMSVGYIFLTGWLLDWDFQVVTCGS